MEEKMPADKASEAPKEEKDELIIDEGGGVLTKKMKEDEEDWQKRTMGNVHDRDAK